MNKNPINVAGCFSMTSHSIIFCDVDIVPPKDRRVRHIEKIMSVFS